jgi:uncharacterized protein (TIGR03086 family)
LIDLVELHGRALDEFGARVAAVRDDQWHLPTPDADWDVRVLVNHLVYENRWAVPLLEGATVAEVGDRFEGDLLGDDPQAAWAEAAGEARAEVGKYGALTRTVHASFGDISGEEYVSQIVIDHAIHGWDLARAIGADERIDPELVELAFDTIGPQIDQWRQAGAFGAEVALPPGAGRQAELLALTGRRP